MRSYQAEIIAKDKDEFKILFVTEIPEPISLTAVPFRESFVFFTQCRPTWSEQMDIIFMIVKMVCFYLFPLLFMSVAYIQIIRVLWKSGNAPHQAMDLTGCRSGSQVNTFAMNMNASTEGQLRSRRKAAKMLVAVVVMFAFCFLPVHLLSVLRLTVKLTNSEVNRTLSLISHWLCYANSAVNPIIYNFMSGKFRKEFRRAFDSCCQREHDESNYYKYVYGGTLCNKLERDSQSKTDFEIHRLNTFKESNGRKLTRKGTKTRKFRKEFRLSFAKCGQNQSDVNSTRTFSTYIYRYTTTSHSRQSTRSRTEIIQLGNVR
ncbi:hypothetical protein NQ315_007248 [Exocentrus adspersus]|uniref:G-protein coupled receptors family 1 profile domain-containing protein n=1 Tax=Exocentrus adspersus TaxID=1586481 RepID=A0AAV8WDC0_9CUCU|nr:hypothetical protein NQ315_007248 [Exocentrus adspersus]